MRVVIVIKEKNPDTDKFEEVVSHWEDTDTGERGALPPVSPASIGAKMDLEIGEYVMPDHSEDAPKPLPNFGRFGR